MCRNRLKLFSIRDTRLSENFFTFWEREGYMTFHFQTLSKKSNSVAESSIKCLK